MSAAGFIQIDKPLGVTSRAALDTVQTRLGLSRAGHCGTLDPLATGLLVLVFGRARRLQDLIGDGPKTYSAEATLGAVSHTGDGEGPITPRVPPPADPGRAGVETALSAFLGEIEQVPPAHCAVKIDGERAYRLARRDQPVTLPPRRVLVEKITVTAYDFPRVRFDVVCSRGTYVRALARDLGERLGTGAFLSALRRTAIGSLRVEEALTPETASARNIQPVERLLAAFPRVPATAGEALALFHGKRIPLPAAARSLPAGVPLFAWKEQRVLCRLLVGERGAEARCDYWLAEDDVLSPAAGPGPA